MNDTGLTIMDDNEPNFQKVYDDYHGKVYDYLKRMVGDAEAEDLTQEVFVKIGGGLEKFRGESRLSTWIYRIATNVAFDKFRATRPGDGNNASLDDISKENQNTWTGEKEDSTEQRIIRREMNGCIREIIDALPDTYRAVIILSELEGLKDGEISQIIGLGLQATKIRLHRARARLRDELSKACVFYRDERNGLACDRKNTGLQSEIRDYKNNT